MNLTFHIPLNHFINLLSQIGVQEYINISKHLFQTAKLTLDIAKRVGISALSDEDIYLSGLFHDLGLVLKASIENYEIFKDLFKNIPDLEKLVLTFDTRNTHSALSYLMCLNLHFLNPNVSRAIIYHHTPYFEIIDETDDVVKLANCIKAADEISLNCIRIHGQDINSDFIENLLEKISQDKGLLEDVKIAALDSIKDYTELFDIIDGFNSFSSKTLLSLEEAKSFAKLFGLLLDMRSPYTRNHTFLVTEISKQITLETLSEEDSRLIEISALLHDIGKLKIPLGILHKKGPLNDKEMLIMKSHVVETYKMLVRSGLQNIANISASHHERLDGSGYPLGISGKQLTLYSRILQIADVFAALIEPRPYRNALNIYEAIEIIQKEVENGKLDKDVFEKLKHIIKNGFLDKFLENRIRHVFENFFGKNWEKFSELVEIDSN